MPISELQWRSLTSAVNAIRSPNQFLKRRFWGAEDPKSTDNIDLSVILKGREMAPFVKVNGEALIVGGHEKKFQTISPPNIRIKRPFTPSELLFGRQPGTGIYITPQEQTAAVRRHIAIDLGVMENMVVNSEEWLCAQILRGQINYDVTDDGGKVQERYVITLPRPNAHNIASVTPWWDDADPTNPQLEELFIAAKRLVSEEEGLGVTDAIFGQEAATYFRRVIKAQKVTDIVGYNVGGIDLARQYDNDGVIYIGRYCGVDCWEYVRSVTLPDGSSDSMIRSKYVEFIASSGAERVMYYGAIADMDAFEGRQWIGKRFSKSWLQKDPSAQFALLASRPLPWIRRPGSTVSAKVVSG